MGEASQCGYPSPKNTQNPAQAPKTQKSVLVAADCGFRTLPRPDYSPDFSSSDFCLFPNVKKDLRRTKFEAYEAVVHPELKFQDKQDEKG